METTKVSRQDERDHLVAQLARKGIINQSVLDAMAEVPRHEFVPAEAAASAYQDRPLPIGFHQTISQPFVVAYMTELLHVEPRHRILEIGTGSGYQAAVLAEMAAQVYSIEIVPELAEQAGRTLRRLGYDNVETRAGDGYKGWPEHAPFDRVIVTAAAPEVPDPLIEQLAPNGRLVIPVDINDGTHQWIWLITKDSDGAVSRERKLPVRFVPMTGQVME
jgi:protein-L-isoaspartate(D-aspartate) O-methyltransferase